MRRQGGECEISTTVSKQTSRVAHVEHSIVIVIWLGTPPLPRAAEGAAEKSLVLLLLSLSPSLPPLKSHGLSQGHCSSTQNSSSELSARSMTRSCMLLNSLCWGRRTNNQRGPCAKRNKTKRIWVPPSHNEVPRTLQLTQSLPRLCWLYSQKGSQSPYLSLAVSILS